jgi:hypothetical protein
VFYLGFKVYPLHCVLATQAKVCGLGRTGYTEPRGSGRAEPNTNTRYTSYGFINIFLYISLNKVNKVKFSYYIISLNIRSNL